MGTILRNSDAGGTIARLTGSDILRTPLAIMLQPDGKAIYQIGDQRSADSSGFLHGGFIEQGTSINAVKNAGYNLVNEMINGTPPWKDASGAHDPEYVWYQGAYATSRSTLQQSQTMSEAYAAICAFHFTVPQYFRGRVQSVNVTFLNMGATWAYGLPGNPNNKNIRDADYGWSASGYVFPVDFHLLNSATPNYHMLDINANSPYDTYDIGTVGGVGSFQGRRDIWQITGGQGFIPTLTNPQLARYTMGTTTTAQFISSNGGWVVPTFSPRQLPLETIPYRPASGWGGDGTDNYWACVSLRDVKVEIIIE